MKDEIMERNNKEGKKKELLTSRLLEIMKGGKDEGGTENENISQKGQRKKEVKGRERNF